MAEAGEELVASEGPQKTASASLPASECQSLLARGSLYCFHIAWIKETSDAMENFSKHFYSNNILHLPLPLLSKFC